MVKINKIYIDRFKKTKYGYYLAIGKGILLNFNNNLEYEGYSNMYNINYKTLETKINEYINLLISKSLLEVED